MQKIYRYDRDTKLKWFGPGEWIDEPDDVEFEHEGFACRALRIIAGEPSGSVYGGHWCGYVCLPDGHPWLANERYRDIDCVVHGGVTHLGKRFGENEGIWIGFDCAHCNDIIPSMKGYLSQSQAHDALLNQIRHLLPGILDKTYRNLGFVIVELKSLAEQAKQAL